MAFYTNKKSPKLSCSLPSLPCSSPTPLAPATPWASSFLLLQPVRRIQWGEANFPPATAVLPSPGVKSCVQPGSQPILSPAPSTAPPILSTDPSPSHVPSQGRKASPQRGAQSQHGLRHPATAGAAEELQSSRPGTTNQPCVTAGSSSTPWMEIKHRNHRDTRSQACDPK